MMAKYSKRKIKGPNGEIITEELKLIQARIPKDLGNTYKILLTMKGMTQTEHLEHFIISWIIAEQEKLRGEINA